MPPHNSTRWNYPASANSNTSLARLTVNCPASGQFRLNGMIEAHLVGMGEMRGAVVERMKDDPPSLKLRRDAGDEDGVTVRGD